MLAPSSWAPEQWTGVRAAFEQHHKHQSGAGNPLAKYVDWHAGYRAIGNGDVQAAIVDGYLLIYDVGTPWYASTPFIIEQMVLRLGTAPGNYRTVLRALDRLAELHGCKAVIAGNSVGRKALTHVYQRAGYRPAAIQLIKE